MTRMDIFFCNTVAPLESDLLPLLNQHAADRLRDEPAARGLLVKDGKT